MSAYRRIHKTVHRRSMQIIQGVPRETVNILGGHSIGHSKQKTYMNMCAISNGFRDRAI
jgi:hypothetical protein